MGIVRHAASDMSKSHYPIEWHNRSDRLHASTLIPSCVGRQRCVLLSLAAAICRFSVALRTASLEYDLLRGCGNFLFLVCRGYLSCEQSIASIAGQVQRGVS